MDFLYNFYQNCLPYFIHHNVKLYLSCNCNCEFPPPSGTPAGHQPFRGPSRTYSPDAPTVNPSTPSHPTNNSRIPSHPSLSSHPSINPNTINPVIAPLFAEYPSPTSSTTFPPVPPHKNQNHPQSQAISHPHSHPHSSSQLHQPIYETPPGKA